MKVYRISWRSDYEIGGREQMYFHTQRQVKRELRDLKDDGVLDIEVETLNVPTSAKKFAEYMEGMVLIASAL